MNGGTSLTELRPVIAPERIVGELVPPPRFQAVSFDTYQPDAQFPSQATALAQLRQAAKDIAQGTSRRRFPWRTPTPPVAVYIDGGFGVGKTHLLASLARDVAQRSDKAVAYGTFVEFTNLVGALGFTHAVDALGEHSLVCIDEFELDDPGDTVLMSRLMRELADRGVALAATSNTLPESLGQGRFASEDFLREIQALASRFAVVSVDGHDYRHRTAATELATVAGDLPSVVDGLRAKGHSVAADPFASVIDHLALIHPSAYGALLDGVDAVAWTGLGRLERQDQALRLVVLVDRLYDHDVPVLLDTADLPFPPDMLAGGYRKKYYRALSRLGVLAAEGQELAR